MVKSKKQMFLVIISFILVLMLGTLSYAFFNYTRTGSSNNVRVGRVNFLSSQNNTINLTNIFPADKNNLDNTNSGTVTINITGDTNYDKGIEYKVSIVDVQNIVNNKEVPISFSVSASNLGTKSSDYYNERGSTTNVYNLVESGIANNNKDIVIGYIKPDNQGVNGSINVTAFIDKDEVGISDTVSRIENNNLVYGETDSGWIDGRTILTTTEWNGLSTNGISFKVKVEANEGIWVDEPKHNVMMNFYLDTADEWTNYRELITSIEFDTSGEAISDSIYTLDVTALSSESPVTLYILDDELGNNTYKAIVVSDDVIYAPEDATAMFAVMTKLSSFDSTNFRVDDVTNMRATFNKCSSLVNLDFASEWNTSNVTSFYGTFNACSGIENLDGLANWDVSSAENLFRLFFGCTNLSNIDGLFNWNTSNNAVLSSLFYNCSKLENVNALVNWDTSKVINMSYMLSGCSMLNDIRGLTNFKTSLVGNIAGIFSDCVNLIDFSPLAKWDVSSVKDMYFTFGLSTGKVKRDNAVVDFSILSNWDVSNVTDMGYFFQNINILSFAPFKNWNVSNVENFSGTFNQTKFGVITNLEDLRYWDVSSATNMSSMFQDNESLVDASAINDWNINSSIDFTNMFIHTPVHPEFTRVTGTWDSDGTFTPTP